MLLQVVLGVVVLFLIIAMMSVGVLFGRKPIQGSCGGIGAALNDANYECEFCGGDADKCETLNENTDKNRGGETGLAYEAPRDNAGRS